MTASERSGGESLAPGKQLGKYRLERLLGSGGMGAVWEAHDGDLDRRVALKVLRGALVGDAVAQSRLLREARAMARLKHANVITVYDATTADGLDLVAMELIDGQTMAQWIAGAKPRPSAIVDALLAAGRGLAAAHAAGMVHRDFKPHNVLVESGSGRVLVTDFGLVVHRDDEVVAVDRVPQADTDPMALTAPVGETASLPGTRPTIPEVDEEDARSRAGLGLAATVVSGSRLSAGPLDSGKLTRTGAMLGTPAYMAPEQFAGTVADARADQFAFCVTAWEALAGTRPFDGATIAEIIAAQRRAVPSAADRIPRRLRALLARGLATDPKRRWPQMLDLLTALERAWRRPRRIAQLALTGGALAAAVTLFVAMRNPGAPAAPPVPTEGSEIIVINGACTQTGEQAVASAWSADKKSALAERDPSRYAKLIDLVDRWAEDWTTRYDANCAHGADPEQRIKRECFEAQRDELVALVATPAGGSAADAAGLDLARVLPSPEQCDRAPRSVAPPLPTEPKLAAAVQAIRSELLAVRAKRDAGMGATPFAAIDALVARAQATGFAPVYAEAMFTRAVITQLAIFAPAQTDPRAAMIAAYDAFDRAAVVAESAGDDRERVSSLLGQLETVTYLPDRLNDIDGVVAHAKAAIDRFGDPANDYVLGTLRGEIAAQRGDWTAALDQIGAAREGWHARGADALVARHDLILIDGRTHRRAPGDLEAALGLARDLVPQAQLLPSQAAAILAPTVEALAYRTTGRISEDDQQGEPDDDEGHPRTDALLHGGGDPAGGTIAIHTGGLAPATLTDADPKDLVARAHRTSAVRLLVAPIDGTGATWELPVGPTGNFTLAGVHPGRYAVTAIDQTALGDRRGTRAEVAVVAGRTVEVSLDVAPGRPVEIAWTPRQLGVAVLIPASGAVPTTGIDVLARLAHAPWFAVSDISAGGWPGRADAWVARLSVRGGDTTIACLLPGAQLGDSPTPTLAAGDPAPLCKPQ